MTYQVVIICKILHFLTSCLAQLAELFLLLKPCKSSPTKICSYTGCRASTKWVKNPITLIS